MPGRRGSQSLDPPYEEAFVAERIAFRRAVRETPSNKVFVPSPFAIDAPPLPELVGVFAADHVLTGFAAETALRGSRAVIVGTPGRLADLDRHLTQFFAEVAGRGRATPLEVEQTRKRLTLTDDPFVAARAGLVVADPRAGCDPAALERQLRPAAVLGVLNAAPPPRPRAVGLTLSAHGSAGLVRTPATDPAAVAALAAWLPRLGFRHVSEAAGPATVVAPMPVAA